MVKILSDNGDAKQMKLDKAPTHNLNEERSVGFISEMVPWSCRKVVNYVPQVSYMVYY